MLAGFDFWCVAAGEIAVHFGSGVFRFAAEFFRERNNLAAARFYVVERARGNIAHEHFFKRHGFGAELQTVGIGLFFAAVLVLDGVGQPKSGLPL